MKKFPNAFVIMLGVILLAWVLTYLIPTGSYQRSLDPENGTNRVVHDSYQPLEAESVGAFDLLNLIPKGLIDRADLIVLILLVGGSFYVIEKTGALGQVLGRVIGILKGKESLALILVSVLFAAAGATIGLQEEVIAMTPILIAFTRSMGFNALVALAISFGSAILGAAFSPMNPFAVVLAQGEAEIPLLSGSVFRLVVMLVALILWITYCIRYAKRNRISAEPMSSESGRLTARSIWIMVLLCLTFSAVTYGLLSLDWGFNQITACFFALGITAGLISGMGLNGTTQTFVSGMKEMTFAAVILGLANCIPLILTQGGVIDTIIFALFTPMEGLPSSGSALGMMLSQAILHFPVSSYSGQALLTMPILVPLADLVGVSRQVCVLAYQYGAVNMDLVVPTNGALMGILAIANIPYNQWFRFIWKPALMILALGGLAVVVGVLTGF